MRSKLIVERQETAAVMWDTSVLILSLLLANIYNLDVSVQSESV